MTDTTQRLENAISHQPDRWHTARDKNTGELLEAWDRDTGRLWTKVNDGWIWID